MLLCAYCDQQCQPTREHVIPRWYNDTPGDSQTFSARAPITHVRGDLTVKDVCQSCNGGALSNLAMYGKQLYKRYFAASAYAGESVCFEYEGDRLLRWLLKLSYNSARAQNADVKVLREYRDVMLGTKPMPDRIRCWLHLLPATYFDPARDIVRVAQRSEQGHENVHEGEWFRVCQLRLRTYQSLVLVQRMVIINSFTFSLLVAPADLDWPNEEFEEWMRQFAAAYPEAKQLVLDWATTRVKAGDESSLESLVPLMLHYPSRFSEDPDPFVASVLASPAEDRTLMMLSVSHEWVQKGEIKTIAATLDHMVSTRENAAAYRLRVGIMVEGYHDDPRPLWEVPKVRSFFRRLFVQCPYIMLLSHPDGNLLKLAAACWVYRKHTNEQAQKKLLNGFVARGFRGLNATTHKLALSEEQNQEICEAAVHVLLGRESREKP